MNLFEYENGMLTVSPQAYGLTPFKNISKRDKTKSKDKSLNEMLYVYYMADYKSDFADILDEDERSVDVIKVLELPKNWKPDKIIKDAVRFYKDRRDGMSMRMLESAKILASKIEKYCRTVDLDERDKNTGKPVHNIKQINDVLQQFGKTVDSLNKLESQVKKDIADDNNMIGSREKNLFEDGI